VPPHGAKEEATDPVQLPARPKELAASQQRYVVSDLLAIGLGRVQMAAEAVARPPAVVEIYPWNEPIVYRAG
jgi:hypothetical protein